MAITTYSFFAFNTNYTYDKWDVIQGGGASATDTRYFYSTVGGNVGAYPLSRFIYTALSTTRTSDEVMRVAFTQTGTAYFRQGSMVTVQGVTPDGSANYTGVALGGGDGYVDFLCAGLTSTNATTAGQVIAPIHPNWSTGFCWVPGYSTKVNSKQAVIQSNLGDGFSQRMNTSINSNALSWNLVFENRTDKEERAIANFLQDKCGVIPFVLAFPVGRLYNRNDLRFISGEPEHSFDSYGVNTLTVPVMQVFDV
jgi:phage-related protein